MTKLKYILKKMWLPTIFFVSAMVLFVLVDWKIALGVFLFATFQNMEHKIKNQL